MSNVRLALKVFSVLINLMWAMVLNEIGPVEKEPLKLTEIPIPEPDSGEIRVKVLACGVCHTDIHIVEGDIKPPALPLILGHQIVGVVEKTGPGVEEPLPGKVVGVPWLGAVCGRCRYCERGMENLCSDVRFTGFHYQGGYAEYTIVKTGFCYPLPEEISPVSLAPLLCAGVIGYRSLKRAEIKPGDSVGLYGFGASAHICLQILKHWGCRVAVFTRTSAHQTHARELGAGWVGTAQEKPPFRLDAGVIFAPAGELVPLALAHLDKGGTIALAGIHMSPIPGFNYRLIYEERTVRSVANSTRDDVREFLCLAREISIRTTVTNMPLNQANEALIRVKHSQINGAVVLVV